MWARCEAKFDPRTLLGESTHDSGYDHVRPAAARAKNAEDCE